MGEASRMTQYKDKSSKGENVTVGLFTYPILMASDILLYDADLIPVGIDQKQHVELARDLAERFNKNYGDTFKVPEPLIPRVGAKIMDLQNPTKKMSKSDDSYKGVILLLDEEKVIRKKIMSAVTDSENKVYYDVENKPGISNLLTIYASLKEISIEETENHFKDYNYGNLKKEVADQVVEVLTNIQNRYNELINNNEIDKILDKVKEEYPNATHYCFGYVIDNDIRSSDDGEPSKTAGIPILNQITSNNLNYVLIIVVRYFGGIKLGAGPLTRTYAKVARDVINTFNIIITKNNIYIIAMN